MQIEKDVKWCPLFVSVLYEQQIKKFTFPLQSCYKSIYFVIAQGTLEKELIRVQASLQSELSTKKQADSQKMELEGK